MKRENTLLKLISDDLRTLHHSAVTLEKNLRRVSQKTESQDLASLSGLISQINCVGFAPIEEMLRNAGLPASAPAVSAQPLVQGVLAESAEYAAPTNKRLAMASVISVMRRAARYMEIYCTSIAEMASRLRLTALAHHLRTWAREWIGLELNLNSVAARSHTSQRRPARRARPEFALPVGAFAAA